MTMKNDKGKLIMPSFWYGTASQRLVELQWFANASYDIADDTLNYWYSAN